MSQANAGTTPSGVSPAPALAAAWARPSVVVLGALAVAVPLVAAFLDWFQRQTRLSINSPDDWGHAFLAPAVSVWLLWRKRELLSRLPVRVFWPGLVPLAAGLVYYVVTSVFVRNHMLEGVCLIVTVYGAVLLLTGPAMARAAFVPIAFLGFMVTISEQVMLSVTWVLQAWAASGSHVFLQVLGPVLGYTADLQGNTIVLLTNGGQEIPLNVAEACSGMRMVVAFYALASAVAVGGFPGFECARWWQRAAVIAVAGPVAVLMNMLRVAALGWASLIDPNLAAGEAHTLIGMVLLLPSLALFLGLVWVLQRVESDA